MDRKEATEQRDLTRQFNMKCGNNVCGQDLQDSWDFCPYCGQDVIRDDGGQEWNSELDLDLPPFDLMKKSVSFDYSGMDHSALLKDIFEEFELDAEVVSVECGPLVSGYMIKLGRGVRIEQLTELESNIAMRLEVESIRIVAPVPGKNQCAIEIPSNSRCPVMFAEIITPDHFRNMEMVLPLALGKTSAGKPFVRDLSNLPHLLIAGAPGAGKTTLLHALISGLLMRATSDELKLILFDPKGSAFSSFSSMPHLGMPVINDACGVAGVLKWLVDELERRYRWFRQAGVRNIMEFNNREDGQAGECFGGGDDDEDVPESLPRIVFIADEFSDSMAVDAQAVESCIARLASKSGNVGIHLILSTDRPSVKVVTGTIKANFPARIAFKLNHKVDSRTILDELGAESLMSPGDILFSSPEHGLTERIHCPYISEDDALAIVEFHASRNKLAYIPELEQAALNYSEKRREEIANEMDEEES